MSDDQSILVASRFARWRSTEHVAAGEITGIEATGCMVRCADMAIRLLPFTTEMVETGRVKRIEVGDYWLIFDDGFQTTSKRFAFEFNYEALPV